MIITWIAVLILESGFVFPCEKKSNYKNEDEAILVEWHTKKDIGSFIDHCTQGSS